MTEDEASKPPAPGKWSVKEVLGHLCDTERVMTYRLMRFARGDEKELQGFEQDDYVAAGDFNSRVRHDLMVEFKTSGRAPSRWSARSLPRRKRAPGIANGNPVSVRALAYIIAGHAQQPLGFAAEGITDSASARTQSNKRPCRPCLRRERLRPGGQAPLIRASYAD